MAKMSSASLAVLEAYVLTDPDGNFERRSLANALRAVAEQIDHGSSGLDCINAICKIASEIEPCPSLTPTTTKLRMRLW